MIKNILSEFKYRRRRKKIARFVVMFFAVAVLLILISSQITKVDLNFDTYEPKIEKIINNTFDAEVYFNDEMNTTVFSDLIVSEIDRATESIYLSMYSFDMAVVKDALVSASDRGIDVKIVFDLGKEGQHNKVFADSLDKFEIFNVGGDIEIQGDYMHHKFMIVDGESDNASLLMGSLNYTRLQELYDPSFIIKISDPDVIDAFNSEFNLLTTNTRGYKKLREKEFSPFSHDLTYSNGHVEVWFSPGFKANSIKERMLDLIKSASTSIDIMIWRMTDDDIGKALFMKAAEGVEIRIITDDFFLLKEHSSVMNLYERVLFSKNENVEILSDFTRVYKLDDEDLDPDFNPFLHQHTMIVDEATVLAGTNNWSYAGFYKNDESIIVTDVPNIVDSFMGSFKYHYEDLSSNDLNYPTEDLLLQ